MSGCFSHAFSWVGATPDYPLVAGPPEFNSSNSIPRKNVFILMRAGLKLPSHILVGVGEEDGEGSDALKSGYSI